MILQQKTMLKDHEEAEEKTTRCKKEHVKKQTGSRVKRS